MNGSRLSDDAAFLEGARLLRGYLHPAAGGGDDDAERALRMIGMRYPEQADAMRNLLSSHQGELCLRSLAEVEEQYRLDNEE